MENEIEKKIKDLKEFIKQKTDQGTANYLGKELRELCGMVETEALRIPVVPCKHEDYTCYYGSEGEIMFKQCNTCKSEFD